MSQTLAQRVTGTQLVFVGDVLQVDAVILDPEPFVYRVRVRVLEAYKGTRTGEQTFDFDATPESYRFAVGQRVVVYASRNQHGKFSTQCSNTRQTQLDDEELIELRRVSAARDNSGEKHPK